MKPILFNTEMVRAILDGRKTVTRRVIKSQPDKEHSHELGYVVCGDAKDIGSFGFGTHECGGDIQYVKPPYEVNDILYVREAWQMAYTLDNNDHAIEGTERYIYAASPEDMPNFTHWVDANGEYRDSVPWRPSIHMPKEAARIFLKVTGVRVERLQEITEEQAKAEGVVHLFDDLPDAEYTDWTKRIGKYPKGKEEWGYKNYLWHGNFGKYGSGNWKSDLWDYQRSAYDTAIGSFSSLWQSTLQKDQLQYYSWGANPYVWVIEFEVIDKAAALKEG